MKARLAPLIRRGVVIVREIDAKQGGSLNVGIDDDSSNGHYDHFDDFRFV